MIGLNYRPDTKEKIDYAYRKKYFNHFAHDDFIIKIINIK